LIRRALAALLVLGSIAVRPSLAGESWFGVYVGGKKAGWMVTRRGEYRIEKRMRLELRSKGRDLSLRVDETWVFASAPPHALKRAYRVRNGRVVAEARDVAGYTWRDASAADAFLAGKPKDGDVFRGRAYDLAAGQVTEATIRVARSGAGTNADGHELAWDGRGRLVVIRTPSLEMRREPEAEAREGGRGGDLYALGLAPVDRHLGPSEYVAKLRLRAVGEGRAHVRGANAEGIVTLPARPRPATRAEVAAALRATRRYPLRHPRLVAEAGKLRRKAATPEGRARAALHFARNYLRAELPGREAVTAVEVLEARRGDCTESAVLFVALARALGVPAREVEGYLYLGDEEKAFGGHRWCEVVLDGRWREVDPSWGQFSVDAAHVALEPGGLRKTRGTLRFEVLDVEQDPIPGDD